jgi:hypothetical protein
MVWAATLSSQATQPRSTLQNSGKGCGPSLREGPMLASSRAGMPRPIYPYPEANLGARAEGGWGWGVQPLAAPCCRPREDERGLVATGRDVLLLLGRFLGLSLYVNVGSPLGRNVLVLRLD